VEISAFIVMVFCCSCLNCHAEGTRSSDLRLIKEHCITVDKDFDRRAVFEECIRTKTFQHWQKKDKIKCAKCLSDWGVRALYKDHHYSVLTAISFEIFGPDFSCTGPFRDWNEMPFKIRKQRRRPKPVGSQQAAQQ